MGVNHSGGPAAASAEPKIRVVALIETTAAVGPAKNLLEFARYAGEPRPGLPKVEVCVTTFQRGEGGADNGFTEALGEAGIPFEVIAEKHRFDPRVLSKLITVLERRRPHIIQTHNVKSHLLVRLLGARRGTPWIAFQHGYTNKDLKDRIYNQFDRYTLRHASLVVAVCGAFRARLERWGVPPSRITVLHNPARPFLPPEPSETAAVRQQLGLAPGTPLVLSVGRLSREKGHADLLRAAAILRRAPRFRAVRFVIVGDGAERGSLAALANRLGLNSDVTFTGQRSDVRPFYALADVLALPSRSEGSPNVILEAMAAGVPVVATAVGGVPEIVTDSVTGLLVPDRDPASMAEALSRVLPDAGLRRRLSAAAKAHLEAEHSQEAYCGTLVGIYQEMVRSSQCQRL